MAGVLALTPPALIAGYGVTRAGASLCNEARNAVFAKVGGGLAVACDSALAACCCLPGELGWVSVMRPATPCLQR